MEGLKGIAKRKPTLPARIGLFVLAEQVRGHFRFLADEEATWVGAEQALLKLCGATARNGWECGVLIAAFRINHFHQSSLL